MPFSRLIILCAFLFYNLGQSQNQTHTVEKGENVYRISLRYGVPMQAIFDANPGSESVITVGQNLIIPVNTNSEVREISSKDGSYVVLKGDTKYGLSKRFGTSISELESLNPQIKNGLQAGHVLKIPSGSQINSTQTTPVTGSNTHTIKKGETLWSISQAYGVKVQPVLDVNPGIDINDLQVGQIINLPESSPTSPIEYDYIVKAGDTKFGLSQRFNMTIAQLEELNPEIKDGLKKDQGLMLSGTINQSISETTNITSDPEPTQSTTETSASQEYIDYVIQPKETLYGLSQKAGMSIDEFVKLNPELETEVIAGTTIKMPVSDVSVDTTQPIETPSTDNAATTVESTVSSGTSLRSSVNTAAPKKIVWLLPKGMDVLESETGNSNVSIDQYRGGHLAINDLKENNFKIDETVVDVSSKSKKELNESVSEADLVIASGELVGTLNSMELKEGSAILNLSMQPITPQTLNLNPIANFNKQSEALFDYIESKNGNIIVINDSKRSRDRALIEKHAPNAGFIKIKSNDNFDESDLVALLKSSKLNIVIINSNKTSVFLNATNALLRQYAKYDVQLAVLNPALIPSNDNISDKRFRILNLMFPTILKLENIDSATKFSSSYKSEFGNSPSSFACTGFEATYDALLRLFHTNGINESWPLKSDLNDYLDLQYTASNNDTMVNNEVFIYKYKSDSGFEKIN